MDIDNHSRKRKGQISKMSYRSLVMAIRYGLADWENGVNVQKMIAVIENGDVMDMNGVGKKTILEWCIFITQRTNSTAQDLTETESRGKVNKW
jgi:hypothetical protein